MEIEHEEDKSRPRITGCLRVSIVKNLPFGQALMIKSLKELVPMSMDAKSVCGICIYEVFVAILISDGDCNDNLKT